MKLTLHSHPASPSILIGSFGTIATSIYDITPDELEPLNDTLFRAKWKGNPSDVVAAANKEGYTVRKGHNGLSYRIFNDLGSLPQGHETHGYVRLKKIKHYISFGSGENNNTQYYLSLPNPLPFSTGTRIYDISRSRYDDNFYNAEWEGNYALLTERAKELGYEIYKDPKNMWIYNTDGVRYANSFDTMGKIHLKKKL